MNITLIGYRGSGKSSIGRRLAELLGREFADADAAIVEAAGGMTIREIFEREDEAGFRRREAEAIRGLCAGSGRVIAAGGGAVLNPDNVAAMKARGGKVVWLEATPEVLYERIRGDAATAANRPRLTALEGIEEVRAILQRRMSLYEAAADVRLEVSQLDVETAARRLAALV